MLAAESPDAFSPRSVEGVFRVLAASLIRESRDGGGEGGEERQVQGGRKGELHRDSYRAAVAPGEPYRLFESPRRASANAWPISLRILAEPR